MGKKTSTSIGIPVFETSFLTTFLIMGNIILYITLYYFSLTKGSLLEFISLLLYIISFLSMLFILAFFLKYGISKNELNFILITFISYFLFLIVYAYLSSDNTGINMSSRILVLNLILILISFMKWTKQKVLILPTMLAIYSIILFLKLITDGEVSNYAGFFLNPNILGVFIFLTLYFHIIAYYFVVKKYKLFWLGIIFIDISLIIVSSTRSVWLSLITGIMLLFIFQLNQRYKRIVHNSLFMFISLSSLSFPFIYISFYKSEFGWQFNNFIISLTGKSLFSGREKLWIELFEYIKFQPLLGYGPSTIPADLINTTLSSHNTYIQILLQTGIIGTMLFLLILFSIWNFLFIDKNSFPLKLTVAFFGGILVYSTFEISLVQGGYPINIMQWLVLSFGIVFKLNDIKDNLS